MSARFSSLCEKCLSLTSVTVLKSGKSEVGAFRVVSAAGETPQGRKRVMFSG